ncbi:MAG: phage head-tail connector protein [Candidatus Methanomethylophilaceae archaeon]
MHVTTKSLRAPASEPVSLKDIKEHLAVPDLTADDALLRDLIAQCRSDAEHWTGRIYADRDMETSAVLQGERGMVSIPLQGPVINVISVKVSNGRDETDADYSIYGNTLCVDVTDMLAVTAVYLAGSSQYLDPSVRGAIKEMVRIAYRRDGTDTMSPAVKRMLWKEENL